MKITPLEIRQKIFEKKIRGYDKDEVSAFLQSLSNEWERVLEDNKDLNKKLQHAEKEVTKLREVESSLYKTLKTAEDTGANVINHATKTADLHIKETQMNAEILLNDAKNKAQSMIERAEIESRQIIEELQDAIKGLEQSYRDIENQREIVMQELKNISVLLIDKVEKNTFETKKIQFDDYIKRVKKLVRQSEERIELDKNESPIPSKETSLFFDKKEYPKNKVVTTKFEQNSSRRPKKEESKNQTNKPKSIKEEVKTQKQQETTDSKITSFFDRI